MGWGDKKHKTRGRLAKGSIKEGVGEKQGEKKKQGGVRAALHARRGRGAAALAPAGVLRSNSGGLLLPS